MLVDIDHTPRHHLGSANADFYSPAGLRPLLDRLHPGGVFGLWSDGLPDAEFVAMVKSVFGRCEAEIVRFDTPFAETPSACTVYLASAPA